VDYEGDEGAAVVGKDILGSRPTLAQPQWGIGGYNVRHV
jgi:hypothetical protein